MMKKMRAVARGIKNSILYSSTDVGALRSPGYSTAAGKTVNATTALCTSVAYDCVRKNGQVFASLPLAQYEKQADGSRLKIEDDLTEILCRSPNSDQTALEFWEGASTQLDLRGNAYFERLDIRGNLVSLRPIFNVTPKRQSNGRFAYDFYDRGKRYTLPHDKVFHIRGFGPGDGLGLSTISYGAASMGAALAADETAASVFSNKMMAAGVLSSEQTLSPEQRTQLATLLDAFVGSSRAGKILTLEAGLKFDPLQMDPEDAQLLESRRYSVEDICRWFGTPPIVVGHASDGQTMWGTGVEAILTSWQTLGINPKCNRVEARVKKDLIAPKHRRTRYFEFNREAMVQMDSKAKADFIMKMRISGVMTGDEARDKLNMQRRGGNADELFIQSSMTPVDLIGKDDQK